MLGLMDLFSHKRKNRRQLGSAELVYFEIELLADGIEDKKKFYLSI